MVHVTEANLVIIDSDLMIRECINASEGRESFAYILSPFMSDFKIPRIVTHFVSNIISISDIEFYSDLIRLLRNYGGSVNVITRSPSDLSEMGLSTNFINRQKKFMAKLLEMGCEVRLNSSLHAKATITSQGALVGSFNLTPSGRYFNIEAGNFFPNIEGKGRKEYMDKLRWAKEVFEKSTPLNLISEG